MFSGQRLKERRVALKLTQSVIADELGINKVAISNWEQGKNIPNKKHMSRLAELLSVEELYFQEEADLLISYHKLNDENKERVVTFSQQLVEEQESAKVIELPTERFEYKVYERLSAGTGFSYFNDGNYDTVYFDEELDHDFASWVFGDSMEPTYLNGEVVLIKQTGFDYDGAIYAIDWDGQTYIKKVYREDDGLRLVSLNNKYADKFAPYNEEPRVIGKIVGHFMPLEN